MTGREPIELTFMASANSRNARLKCMAWKGTASVFLSDLVIRELNEGDTWKERVTHTAARFKDTMNCNGLKFESFLD